MGLGPWVVPPAVRSASRERFRGPFPSRSVRDHAGRNSSVASNEKPKDPRGQTGRPGVGEPAHTAPREGLKTMKCPKCGNNTEPYGSKIRGDYVTKRGRRCKKCSRKWYTWETFIDPVESQHKVRQALDELAEELDVKTSDRWKHIETRKKRTRN